MKGSAVTEAARKDEPNDDPDDEPGKDNGQGVFQPAATFEVMQRLSISASEVWVYYVGMGGGLDEWEVTSYLHGILELATLDRDMISQTVNELYDDLRRSPKAPYSWQCAEQEPPAGTGTTMAADTADDDR